MNGTFYGKIVKWTAVVMAILFGLSMVVTFNLTEADNDYRQQVAENMEYFQNFELQGLDGEEITQDYLKGYKVTVFNGWAPWCGPCTSEMPDLEMLGKEYEEKGLHIVGIVADYYPQYTGENASNAASYNEQIRGTVAATGVTYPIVVSDERFFDEPFIMMNNAFPGTWAIDEEGHIIDFVSGARSEDAWRSLFDEWLEGR